SRHCIEPSDFFWAATMPVVKPAITNESKAKRSDLVMMVLLASVWLPSNAGETDKLVTLERQKSQRITASEKISGVGWGYDRGTPHGARLRAMVKKTFLYACAI